MPVHTRSRTCRLPRSSQASGVGASGRLARGCPDEGAPGSAAGTLLGGLLQRGGDRRVAL